MNNKNEAPEIIHRRDDPGSDDIPKFVLGWWGLANRAWAVPDRAWDHRDPDPHCLRRDPLAEGATSPRAPHPDPPRDRGKENALNPLETEKRSGTDGTCCFDDAVRRLAHAAGGRRGIRLARVQPGHHCLDGSGWHQPLAVCRRRGPRGIQQPAWRRISDQRLRGRRRAGRGFRRRGGALVRPSFSLKELARPNRATESVARRFQSAPLYGCVTGQRKSLDGIRVTTTSPREAASMTAWAEVRRYGFTAAWKVTALNAQAPPW